MVLEARSQSWLRACSLDVLNAFNSLLWFAVLDTLKTKLAALGYLLKIIQYYFQDRELIYDTSQRRRKNTLLLLPLNA